MTDAAGRWDDALLVARLFARDPAGFGGVVVRAGAGPVRDAWLAALKSMLRTDMPFRKMPPSISDERLLGGLDLTATLARGEPVARSGLLAECDGGIVIIPMAERLAEATPHLCAMLDRGIVVTERDGLAMRSNARIGLILLDEGASDDEQPPAALIERCAFLIDLTHVSVAQAVSDIGDASGHGGHVQITVDEQSITALCATAAAFGIASIRAPVHAVHAAKVLAALAGEEAIDEDIIMTAARLVLAPRALTLPAPPPDPEAESEAPPPPASDIDGQNDPQNIGELSETVIEAVRAALPEALLAQLEAGLTKSSSARGSGTGALRKSKTRGRPAGVRRGDPGGQARLHLVETLRAAAPWQRLRQASAPRDGIIVRRDDFRIHRFAERAESTMIFAVDASGSAALERLAETKGAVELLLAEAYVRRTQVALVAFRGERAELVLPPTRSLARAKKCLAGLPGGGGTPLASGVEAAQMLALAARDKGRTPIVIIMTDGRANIARDGTPGRLKANEDALAAARRFALSGISAAVIDVAMRPRDEGKAFAKAMGARYATLPRVEAGAMRDLVRALDPGVR
jgi:magnesium chelatase subunit D